MDFRSSLLSPFYISIHQNSDVIFLKYLIPSTIYSVHILSKDNFQVSRTAIHRFKTGDGG